MSAEIELSINPLLPLIFPSEESIDGEKEEIGPDAAWHYYSHLIRRNPNDLKLHTHRVFFAMRHNNASFLPGSLHDLFFVLKDAGRNLRVRLLKASAPYLSKKDIVYFAMWIKIGIKKGMGYKWIPGSVLSSGLYGPDKVLLEMNTTEGEEAKLSPIEEARSCMEYGQLDIAHKILVEALETDKDNKAIKEELHYLTQYTKSRQIQPEPKLKSTIDSTLGKLKNAIFR